VLKPAGLAGAARTLHGGRAEALKLGPTAAIKNIAGAGHEPKAARSAGFREKFKG